MRPLLLVALASLAASPLRAQSPAAWLQGVMRIVGPLGSDSLPRLERGDSGAIAVSDKAPAEAPAESKFLPWVQEVHRIDKDLDAAYARYREKPGSRAKIDALLKDRAYNAGIFAKMVEPSKDFEAKDPRVSEVLQALLVYLQPLPKRLDAARAGRDQAAKKVERARDRADDSLARLEEADQRRVRAAGLSGRALDKVEAELEKDKRESAQYMGWVRDAYARTASWGEEVKRHESWVAQLALAEDDFKRYAELTNVLVAKKLAPRK